MSCYDFLMFVFIFFFKHKTAYELRISDWSSDVCSSDLHVAPIQDVEAGDGENDEGDGGQPMGEAIQPVEPGDAPAARALFDADTAPQGEEQCGRASCRERVCQYV